MWFKLQRGRGNAFIRGMVAAARNNSLSRTHCLLHRSLQNRKILNLHERNLKSRHDRDARDGDNDEYCCHQNKQSLTHSLYGDLYVSLVYVGLR